MTPPRILLVDDQRQVSRVLRASLELSGREYLVSEVASAEEALAEMSRAPIDLLVTDLRLPAMSGLQLVERAKGVNPNLHTILISGNATEEVRREAESLGVVAFLPKPVGTNHFLEIVEAALEVAEETAAAGRQQELDLLRGQLDDLRRQVGAEATYLIDDRGETVVKSGGVSTPAIEESLVTLMAAQRSAQAVSAKLGALAPATFQYVDGETHDIYLANVGEVHGLVIVHRGQQEAGQLGSVMHYGRRAADVLAGLVEEQAITAAAAASAEETVVQWEEVVAEDKKVDIEPDQLEAAASEVDAGGAEDFWEKAAEESMKPDSDQDSLSYEQAQELGLLEDEEGGSD
jgi:CheY-like chemotaxis protein/predicted regulator of Ras-like GTPase activity (Roadblock/LC7/MglB family)